MVGDQAYLHLGNGRVACVELTNGSDCWISKPFGKYWSMALQQDKILALDEGGELILVRANPQSIQVLDSQQISNQSTWAHLAVSGDQLFVRELEGIAAYRWSLADPSEVAHRSEPNGLGR